MEKFNVLVIGAGGLNAALRARGHAVFHVGPASDSDVQLTHPLTLRRLLALVAERGFAPNALLHLDNGNLPQVVDVETAAMPSVFYSIDTYCNPWHIPYANAFDAVTVAQKAQLVLFTEQGHNARWMPLFATRFAPEKDCTPAAFAERDVPVAFVGTLDPKNIPARKPFLQRFRARHPLVTMQGDYVPLFSRARIVLNQTAFSELNYRCFEAPACGAALLMEDSADLADVFNPGETCLPAYPRDNDAEAVRVAENWLNMPEQLANIAEAGRELVLRRHSAPVRAAEIEALLCELAATGAVAHRLAALPRRRTLLSTAYAILLLELNAPALAEHRKFYARLYASLIS